MQIRYKSFQEYPKGRNQISKTLDMESVCTQNWISSAPDIDFSIL
ncbi:hypothetical protein PAV_9c00490 [Paenibacillus alvei DSM 29]|nr:hypothetical protein PAV_9c00490 [Paenibacillus alvei DSM 29]